MERVTTMRAIQVFVASLLLAAAHPQVAVGDDETFLDTLLPGAGGSVSIEDNKNYWELKCKLDTMEDYRYCFISFRFELLESGHFSARVNQGGKVYLWATGGDAYPGSQQVIRVDANNAKQDKEHPLKGFGEALDLALAIVNGKEFSLPPAAPLSTSIIGKAWASEGHGRAFAPL